jgi:hypothetical protein
MAEVSVGCAGGDDEKVVGESLILGNDLLVIEVEINHFLK